MVATIAHSRGSLIHVYALNRDIGVDRHVRATQTTVIGTKICRNVEALFCYSCYYFTISNGGAWYAGLSCHHRYQLFTRPNEQPPRHDSLSCRDGLGGAATGLRLTPAVKRGLERTELSRTRSDNLAPPGCRCSSPNGKPEAAIGRLQHRRQSTAYRAATRSASHSRSKGSRLASLAISSTRRRSLCWTGPRSPACVQPLRSHMPAAKKQRTPPCPVLARSSPYRQKGAGCSIKTRSVLIGDLACSGRSRRPSAARPIG
jgi:hypothetical protein